MSSENPPARPASEHGQDRVAHADELRSIIRFFDEHNAAASAGLPAPSVEYLLYAIARLLEAITWAIERGEPLPSDITDRALQIARHGHRYLDHYLTIGADEQGGERPSA
jgi:hypothetical protein